jgi:hypothetical protein
MPSKCFPYALLFSHLHAACPAHLILLDLIIQFARTANHEAPLDIWALFCVGSVPVCFFVWDTPMLLLCNRSVFVFHWDIYWYVICTIKTVYVVPNVTAKFSLCWYNVCQSLAVPRQLHCCICLRRVVIRKSWLQKCIHLSFRPKYLPQHSVLERTASAYVLLWMWQEELLHLFKPTGITATAKKKIQDELVAGIPCD